MGLKEKLEFKKYLKKAQNGETRFQCLVGTRYRLGRGVEQNFDEAVKWYYEAAKNGNVSAFHYIGICYENGQGLPKDLKTALDCYIKVEDSGSSDEAESIIRVAIESGIAKTSEYFYNRGNTQYNKKAPGYVECAIIYYKKAAEMGSASAMNMLGHIYISDDFFYDPYESYDWTLKAANLGNRDAQNRLGWVYEKGKCGKQQNLTEAVKWYEKAAAQGHIEAKKAVARLKPAPVAKPAYTPAPKPATPTKSAYTPAPKPATPAKPAYTPAPKPATPTKSASVVKPAVPNLTAQQWYDKGNELSQAENRPEAYQCYLRAAEMGHAAAMCSTGSCLLAGKGVTKDYKAAFAWYQKSADSGYEWAFQRLADCYKCGIAVPRDLYKARSLYSGRNSYEVYECDELIKDFNIIGNVAPFTGLPDYDDGYVPHNDIGIDDLIKLLNRKQEHMNFKLRSLEFENDLYITATLYVRYVGSKDYFNTVYGHSFKHESKLDRALERDYNNSGLTEFIDIVDYQYGVRKNDYENAKSKINSIIARTGREEFLKSALISLEAQRCRYNIIGTKNGKSRRIRKFILNWL